MSLKVDEFKPDLLLTRAWQKANAKRELVGFIRETEIMARPEELCPIPLLFISYKECVERRLAVESVTEIDRKKLVDTVLPLVPWTILVALEPDLNDDERRRFVGLFLPPSGGLKRAIHKELGDLAGPAMRSASHRRRFRRFYKNLVRDQLEDNPFASEARSFFRCMRQADEVGRGDSPPRNATKLRDIEAKMKANFELMATNPRETYESIPPTILKLGPREMSKLNTSLGISLSIRGGKEHENQYVQTILPLLIEACVDPKSVELVGHRKNSPVWRWPGFEQIQPAQQITISRVFEAFMTFLTWAATEENHREVIGYVLTHMLRGKYGLGAGRGHESVHGADSDFRPTGQNWEEGIWDPQDSDSSEEYEKVETRIDLETAIEPMLDQASPKQRQAAEIYLECYREGRGINEIAGERGLDPVKVRNNFQALARKYRK